MIKVDIEKVKCQTFDDGGSISLASQAIPSLHATTSCSLALEKIPYLTS
jgi:hypothetical protein